MEMNEDGSRDGLKSPRTVLQRATVCSLEEFDRLRAEWDDLRRADPYGTVFLSWGWLRAFFSMSPTPWSILTLREDDELVAAFPISIRPAPHRTLPIARELTFASAPFADYQGLLSRPEHEAEALAAFADMVLSARWERAQFSDVRDPRIAELVRRLGASGIATRETEPTPCSVIDLPGDFESYLSSLSKPTRRGTLRPVKVMNEELPGWRFSDATAENADAHIEATIHVNNLRWGGSPLRSERLRRLLRAAFAEGCLRVTVLWDGDRPFGAGAAFVDPERSTYGAYLVGHDPEYARFSPGKAILASRIREAIEGGFRIFDFMRGGESYKASYATREVHNRHFSLVRHTARAALLSVVQSGYSAVRAAIVRLRTSRRAA